MIRLVLALFVAVPSAASVYPWTSCASRISFGSPADAASIVDGYAAIWAHGEGLSFAQVPLELQKAFSETELRRGTEDFARSAPGPVRQQFQRNYLRQVAAYLRYRGVGVTLYAFSTPRRGDDPVVGSLMRVLTPSDLPTSMEQLIVHPNGSSSWGELAAAAHTAGRGQAWGGAVRIFATLPDQTSFISGNGGTRSIAVNVFRAVQAGPGDEELRAYQELLQALRR